MFLNIFPLIDKNIKNGLFEPLPYYPEDSWQNQNRHQWSEEEIDELCKKYIGEHDHIQPEDNRVILWEYKPKDEAKFYIADDFVKRRFHCGRVMKIGKKCFDIYEFGAGASATYGDLVFYHLASSTILNKKNKRVISIEDVDILGLIRSEEEINP